MQWRGKLIPRELIWLETSKTSRTRRPPLERGLGTKDATLFPIPIPTNEEIMGELREVTVRYEKPDELKTAFPKLRNTEYPLLEILLRYLQHS